MSQPRTVPLDPKYAEGIRKGLDAAFKRAEERPLDPAADKIAIFSDHHKGVGDPADDFRRCEHAYTAALGYYLEAGYRLFLLGDVEELWEERAGPVIEHYRAVLDLEAQFREHGGLERFYGNHDDDWRNAGAASSASTATTTTSGRRPSRSPSTCGRSSGRSTCGRGCG